MRAVLGRLSLFVGAFALVAAAVSIFWGKDAAYRIPLDTDSYTRLTGQASGSLAKSDTPVDVTYIVHTQVDPKHSNGDVIAMEQTSCMALTSEYCIDGSGKFVLAGTDEQIVNIAHKAFAIDRKSSWPVKDQSKYILDASLVEPYEGVVVKFPFNTKKKDYPYWDSTLGATTTAVYKGERTIRGLTTYRFDVDIPATQAEIAAGTQGTYAATQTVWVDPKTGSFIDQTGTQKVTLPDGTNVLDVAVKYTDQTIADNVKTAKSNKRSLGLVGTLARYYAPFIGIAFVALGVWLLRRRPAAKA
ncbi:DUF3068 domain-containing protein [Nocardioides sp.]|uniref:DUF3068 domain-containing protein n=1 Tax=Nocardioides sp. TaxID=35761 RepID=UPI0026197E45|nr:DUF3068 domain-containing protein [Nocardioides sp.]